MTYSLLNLIQHSADSGAVTDTGTGSAVAERYIMVYCGMDYNARYGMYARVLYGMVRYGTVWYGTIWYVTVW